MEWNCKKGKLLGALGFIIAIAIEGRPAAEEGKRTWVIRRKMSKKNNLARRKKQHEFDLQSNWTSFVVQFVRILMFPLGDIAIVSVRPRIYSFILIVELMLCLIRRESGEREEGKEASSEEEQDEGFFPVFFSFWSWRSNLIAFSCIKAEKFCIKCTNQKLPSTQSLRKWCFSLAVSELIGIILQVDGVGMKKKGGSGFQVGKRKVKTKLTALSKAKVSLAMELDKWGSDF